MSWEWGREGKGSAMDGQGRLLQGRQYLYLVSEMLSGHDFGHTGEEESGEWEEGTHEQGRSSRQNMQDLSIYLERCFALPFIANLYKHLVNLCLQVFDGFKYYIFMPLTPQSLSAWVFFFSKRFSMSFNWVYDHSIRQRAALSAKADF